MGVYQRVMKRLGHTLGFAIVMKRLLPRIDRVVSKVTGGRKTFGSTVLPTFVLVHTGAKSGKEYHTPLSYVRSGDGFALAASNWGQDHHPGWSHNLTAHPDVAVIVDGETVPVRARRAPAEEKATLWPRFTEMCRPTTPTSSAAAGTSRSSCSTAANAALG
jgi:deazaflavin-dependent oxidoreductase (nitroreductase family)